MFLLKLILRILYIPLWLFKFLLVLVFTIIPIPFYLVGVLTGEDTIDDIANKIIKNWYDFWG